MFKHIHHILMYFFWKCPGLQGTTLLIQGIQQADGLCIEIPRLHRGELAHLQQVSQTAMVRSQVPKW